MDLWQINASLAQGRVDLPGVLPHLEALKEISYVFHPDFGLDRLPEEGGLLLIRGPRQYGKSTWLESQIKETILQYGSGTALYLNGDEIKDGEALGGKIEELVPLFAKKALVRRLFIDEITAIAGWQQVLKRLIDRGALRDTLVVSTGSKASDIRHGSERLPGRKGKLERNHFLFTPVSFKEFIRVCGKALEGKELAAYLLSGGCPLACNEIAKQGRIPEYVISMIRDWIYGECAANGRNRGSLLAVFEVLIRKGGTPVGQAKLAREAGLANNTVAQGYVEFLGDLVAVAPCFAWDASRKVRVRRKPCKYHFINVLAALAWHPAQIRSLRDFESLPQEEKAKFYEWLVAQELWRRAAVRGDELPEELSFWSSEDHELDFVLGQEHFVEVKIGGATGVEFGWFCRVFPQARLEVITSSPFETPKIQGMKLETFLSSS